MNLKVKETGIPDCFNRYNHIKTNIQWAQNNDGVRGPVGQLLLGTDCAKSFPYNLTKSNVKPIKKRKMSLLISNLTGKIIRFGSVKKYDKEIISNYILVNKIA